MRDKGTVSFVIILDFICFRKHLPIFIFIFPKLYLNGKRPSKK